MSEDRIEIILGRVKQIELLVIASSSVFIAAAALVALALRQV